MLNKSVCDDTPMLANLSDFSHPIMFSLTSQKSFAIPTDAVTAAIVVLHYYTCMYM